MIARKTFLSAIAAAPFGDKFLPSQRSGVETILNEWDKRGLSDLRWLAYMLATTKWETDHTMQPIREKGGTAYYKRMYDPLGERGPLARKNGNVNAGDGALFCGRGFVQLTWRNNYRRLGKLLGQPIESNPDLAMQPAIAAAIMFEGMIGGLFTGKALKHYFGPKVDDPVGARRIINGTDKAREIAAIHVKFLAALHLADVADDAKPTAFADLPLAALPPTSPLVVNPVVPVDPPTSAAAPDDPPTPAPGAAPPGDPDLLSVQNRLKAMNYNPGIPNGVWGGMMSGAISGFVNDRHLAIIVPTAPEMFDDIADDLKTELGRAEAENFTRPVSEQRASGDAATVAQVAPEVVPVKQNYFVAKWTAIVTFFTGLWNLFKDQVAAAWNFFTDHKDDIQIEPGMIDKAWGYVVMVPTAIWILAAAAAIALLAMRLATAVNQIKASVTTGARQ